MRLHGLLSWSEWCAQEKNFLPLSRIGHQACTPLLYQLSYPSSPFTGYALHCCNSTCKIYSGLSTAFLNTVDLELKSCCQPCSTRGLQILSSWTIKFKGEGTSRKLATAMQPQFPRNVANFMEVTGFPLSKRTLRKLMFD
jgi:hypothetical protein